MEIEVLASGSKGNCYRVTDGSTPLLLECGIRIQEIREGLSFELGSMQACLLTHEHKDHSKAIEGILKAGIDVYASPGTIEALAINSPYLHPVKGKQSFAVGSWTIRTFDVQHDAAEPLGYLLHSNTTNERLVFATDTYFVKYRFPGLTHIAIECNYAADILEENLEAGLLPPAMRHRLLTSHFSLDNVKKLLMANDLSQVKGIWLLHLSEGNSDANRFKKEIMELTGKPVYVARQDGGVL